MDCLGCGGEFVMEWEEGTVGLQEKSLLMVASGRRGGVGLIPNRSIALVFWISDMAYS